MGEEDSQDIGEYKDALVNVRENIKEEEDESQENDSLVTEGQVVEANRDPFEEEDFLEGDDILMDINEEEFIKEATELQKKIQTSTPNAISAENRKVVTRRSKVDILKNKRRALQIRKNKLLEELQMSALEAKGMVAVNGPGPSRSQKNVAYRRSNCKIAENKMRAQAIRRITKLFQQNELLIEKIEAGRREENHSEDVRDQSGYGSPHFSSDDEELNDLAHHPDDSTDEDDDSILYVVRNNRFKLLRRNEIFRQRYNAHEFIFSVILGEQFINKRWKDLLVQLYYVFETCINEVTRNLHPDDLIRIYVNQSQLEKPIVLPSRQISKMNVNDLMGAIEKCLQSKDDLKIDSSLEIQIATISPPRGAGRSKLTKDFINDKRSVIKIRNSDNLCLARSLVVAKADLEYKLADNLERKTQCFKYRKKISQANSKLQKKEAEKLQAQAGLPPNHSCSLADISKFELALEMQIIVSDEANGYSNLLTFGRQLEKKVYLFFHDGHFDVISKIHSFLSRSYFCDICLLGYNDRTKHKCVRKHCDLCYSLECKFENAIECKDCNRICSSLACYEKHKKNGYDTKKKCQTPSVCQSYYKCLKCDKTFCEKEIPRKEHRCDGKFCHNCKEQVFEGHECYQLSKSPKNVSNKYIFFDFECNQESGEHIVNYAVAQKTCKICIDRILDGENLHCRKCGKREVHFSNTHDFCKWVFSKERKGYTLIAHNCKSYDGYFLFNYLLSQNIKPKVIFRGGKILCIHVEPLEMRIIDSLNFIPSPLSQLPETFDIPELKKGYFPFLFNTTQNQDYEGEMPDPKFYLPENMSKKERDNFYTWYNEKKDMGYIFNFKEEMKEYCKSDVDILRSCCLKFRSLLISLTTECNGKDKIEAVDPFQYITISSVCMAVFNFKFLKENTIASLPYVSPDNYSLLSIVWLEWIMHLSKTNDEDPIVIRHGHNSKEYRLGQYKVDGFDEKNKVVYEFNGCFFHGCKYCFPDQTKVNAVNNLEFSKLRGRTEEKEKYLKDTYQVPVISIWECEFKKQILENIDLRDFVKKCDVVDRLNPREAFMGGRTNAVKLKHDCKEGEKIRYVDFCSLYPSVQKYCEYPVGYPTIITKDFEDLSTYFGLVKCRIVPPRKLLHPVLPYKCNDSLRFPLCKTCCDENFQGECKHSPCERALCGTWTTLEVNKAISLGYKIEKIHEVYHFPETTKYDREIGQGGLFTDYINTFLKLKTEASGWPSWVKSDGDKELYIKQYEEKEGIKLDPSNIKVNAGLRSLAKLMLNSFWGRFGMRGDFNHTEIIFEPSDLWQLLGDQTKIVSDFQFFNDDCILVEWKYKKECTPAPKDVNIFIAVFTASHGRLKLYEEIEKLGDKVLYFDTDSIFYVDDGNGYSPQTGDFLGELTNELTCKSLKCKVSGCPHDHHIKTFVSAGPKNYAYVTDNGFACCKIRGFTLNYENSKLLNFDTLHDMISNYPTCQESVFTAECNKISRNKSKAIIYNRKEKKKYTINYVKRVLLSDFKTVPYGF